MFNRKELESLGFNADEIESFDPSGAIVDETNPGQRGKYTSPGKGKDAIFTLRIKNTDAVNQKRVELFNAINSIVNIPNDSQYSNFGAYRPFTSASAINLMSKIATAPEAAGLGADEVDQLVGAVAIFNDINGDLCYINDRTLAQWQATPLTTGNAGSALWVRCSQVPYKRLIEDCKDLVLDVRMTKIQFSSENQKKNPLELIRVKSFGGAESNTLEPSEFFDPENNQSLVINIPRQYIIDKATGIYITLEPSEDMQITFFVKAYRNNGVVLV